MLKVQDPRTESKRSFCATYTVRINDRIFSANDCRRCNGCFRINWNIFNFNSHCQTSVVLSNFGSYLPTSFFPISFWAFPSKTSRFLVLSNCVFQLHVSLSNLTETFQVETLNLRLSSFKLSNFTFFRPHTRNPSYYDRYTLD